MNPCAKALRFIDRTTTIWDDRFSYRVNLDNATIIKRLRPLLGRQFRHLGRVWTLHELLPEAGMLVLRSLQESGSIQADQYGNPLRRSPDTCTISLCDGEDKLSEELLELLANRL